ncbi:hypothetical protein [Candidatus Nitrosocosmicus franklandus]|uniref:Uncharacterized protein n=1 Tax=Candidatus Nitrosocosmicus franklandianus TaxID=1798806 RepID=A0A484IBS1_9ARCH|nr:hypothetical protein [Candidatus Nitrosocosmicus franklandus]VFJ13485.1 protein of unknown function [Candidatus Nitrosocosmicus franklandus]
MLATLLAPTSPKDCHDHRKYRNIAGMSFGYPSIGEKFIDEFSSVEPPVLQNKKLSFYLLENHKLVDRFKFSDSDIDLISHKVKEI